MRRAPFEFMLALRYLRPRRTFVSIITLISVLGVTLGVAVLIIVISVMSGFDKELRDRILGFNTHIKIFKSGQTMDNYTFIASKVSENREVTGVAPFVMGQVLVETQREGEQSLVAAPWIRGIEPEAEAKVTVLPKSIIEGDFSLDGHSVLIGSEFAQNMRLNVGDRLAIFSPRDLERMRKNRGKDGDEAILPEDYDVRGIFDVGYYEYNANVIVTSLQNAQDLYGLENSVHGLMVMVRDPYQAAGVRKELYEALPPGCRIGIWTEENSAILNALVVEKNVMFYLLFFIMIVAAFGITSALITFVVQKTREIGVLKALGASNLQVSVLFLSQSAIVGVIGVVIGYGLGMLALSYRNEFLHLMNRATGWELFPAQIYGFTQLPALIVPRDIAIICGSALVICVLAGVIPAFRAGRLRPVEALRYE